MGNLRLTLSQTLSVSLLRIFRQPQGHLLLIGVSGAGKTTLSRFVAWMNGLSVYQIKVGITTFLTPASKMVKFVFLLKFCRLCKGYKVFIITDVSRCIENTLEKTLMKI